MSYAKSASVYDAIYTSMKNYRKEAEWVYEIVKKSTGKHPSDLSLLDVACGTGLHLEYFAKSFKRVEGLDLSEEQLAIARERLPEVKFHQYNMMSFSLAEGLDGPESSFDVVTCLFSAVGHLTDYDQLRYAVRSMAAHLNPGGVLIIQPWIFPENFSAGDMHATFVDSDDIKVARMSVTTREENVAVVEMHHMVGRPDVVETFVETHRLTMFTDEEYRRTFQRAGLTVQFDPNGLSRNSRGIYIGVKPNQS